MTLRQIKGLIGLVVLSFLGILLAIAGLRNWSENRQSQALCDKIEAVIVESGITLSDQRVAPVADEYKVLLIASTPDRNAAAEAIGLLERALSEEERQHVDLSIYYQDESKRGHRRKAGWGFSR